MNAILSAPKLGAFVISLIVELTFTGVLVFAMFHGISENQTVQILMGALVASQTTVISFWIGSSASAKDKDEVIAKQADTSATATAVAAQAAGVKPNA